MLYRAEEYSKGFIAGGTLFEELGFFYLGPLDGHNIDSLYKFFKEEKNTKQPKAIIANTIKGKGFSFSENNNDWHHAVLTKKLYEQALEELKDIK